MRFLVRPALRRDGMKRGSLHWNWLGKVFTIVSTFAFPHIVAKIDRYEVGLVWHQKRGSLLPALFMVGVICALSWAQAIFDGEASNLSPEPLSFEAIMPGLDERLVFTGACLRSLCRLFVKDDRFSKDVSASRNW